MRADRLLKLADFLETLPREKFDMSDFDVRPWEKRQTGSRCGFSGCALGWAAHKRLFDGLAWSAPDGQFTINRQRVSCHEATLEIFATKGDEEAENIYEGCFSEEGSWRKATPKQVAKRIRKFVKDNAVSA